MFHFPAFPPDALCVQAQVPGLSSRWVSPFGHPRITGRLSASRGFSQTPTSFIGSRCQGIHHVHLVACCYYKDARVHCEVLKVRSVPSTVSRLRGICRAVRGVGGPRVQLYELIPQDPTVCLSRRDVRSEVPLAPRSDVLTAFCRRRAK